MLRALALLIKMDFRTRYSSAWPIFGELFGIIGSLIIYWYISLSFQPVFETSLKPFGSSFFEFVLIGELVLMIPLHLTESIPRTLRQANIDGTLDALRVHARVPIVAILILCASGLVREFLRFFVTLLAAILLFGFKTSAGQALAVFSFQLSALPVFIGVALCFSSIVLYFGRGTSLVAQFSAAASFLAGAYFPVSVLPERLQNIGQNFSPFNFILEKTRGFFSSSNLPSLDGIVHTNLQVLFWGVVFLPVGLVLFSISLQLLRRKGSAFKGVVL